MSDIINNVLNRLTRTRKTISQPDLQLIRRRITMTTTPSGIFISYFNDPINDPDRKIKEVARYVMIAPLVKGRRLLDVGSGSFYGAAMMAETAREVVGFERSRAAVWQAMLTWRKVQNLRCLYGEDLSVVHGCFGAATIVNVIEHMPEAVAERLLRQVRNSLEEDGIVVLVTPRDRSSLNKGQYENPDHKKEYSDQELQALVARSGFRVETKYIQNMISIKPGGEKDVSPGERAWFVWVLRQAA